jgi:hypothetical protein
VAKDLFVGGGLIHMIANGAHTLKMERSDAGDGDNVLQLQGQGGSASFMGTISLRRVNSSHGGFKVRLRDGVNYDAFDIDSAALTAAFHSSLAVNVAGTLNVTGNARAAAGIRIGTDSGDNEIDDATQGSASTNLFIGNAQITVSSDSRVKDNRTPWAGSALDLIGKLSIDEFDYAEGNQPIGGIYAGRYVAPTAQDVFAVMPWAVNTQGGAECQRCLNGRTCKTHPHPWTVKAELEMGVVMKAIQELNEKVEAYGSN